MRRWRTGIVVGILLTLAGWVSGLQAQVTAQKAIVVPPLTLSDQFGQDHTLADLRGRVLVLVYGDRKSAEANRALGEWLHVTFHPAAQGQPPAVARRAPVRPVAGLAPGSSGPEVVAVPVAVVGKVPSVVAGIIRRQVRCGSPEVPVWLDFQDDMADLFGLKPGVPNVAVVDCRGQLRYTATGPLTPGQRDQLADAIESLRREEAGIGH